VPSLSVSFGKVITCLDDVCTIEYESVSDCMIKLFLALAYPSVICCVFCCMVLSFAMIINLLM